MFTFGSASIFMGRGMTVMANKVVIKDTLVIVLPHYVSLDIVQEFNSKSSICFLIQLNTLYDHHPEM